MNLDKLREEQFRLAKKVSLIDSFREFKTIGGCDVAYYFNSLVAVVVVLDYPALTLLEKEFVIGEAKFPYISGYMFYREVPAIMEAYNKLKEKPDIMMCDFNGILHPRRFGAACHLGLLIDKPTIGISKALLCGEVRDNLIYINNEPRGVQMFTRTHAKPIYVSPGHKISLETSVDITRKCLRENSKLPEPLKIAHMISVKLKHRLKEGSGAPAEEKIR